jgi:hypothetical protein
MKNFYIVMRALENGIPVKIGDFTYTMDEAGLVGMVFLKEKNINGSKVMEEVLILSDVELNSFIKECGELTETEIMSLVFANGMKSIDERKKQTAE